MMRSAVSEGAHSVSNAGAMSPVVVAVPHAGRAYPNAILRAARVGQDVLQRLEDRFVDRLTTRIVAAGIPVVIAMVPRCVIDLNRAVDDMDPSVVAGGHGLRLRPSARARAGLGLVPHALHGAGALWRAPIAADDLMARIAQFHAPYHDAITAALFAARSRFPRAVLIDLHSMPSLPADADGVPPGCVIGDRFGVTSGADVPDLLARVLEARGISTARNEPYAGGHSVQRHADRRRGIEAVQLEFDRALYLGADSAPNPSRADALAAVIADCVFALAGNVANGADAAPIAAE